MSEDSYERLPPPPTARAPLVGARDETAAIAALREKRPVDPHFEAAFMRNRFHVARTHPSPSLAVRAARIGDLTAAMGRMHPAAAPPAPGGVGYGTFYTPEFKTAFDGGSELLWNVICPDSPGGDVASILYLTATNRASLGVEALVAYVPNDGMSFMVYDWSVADAPGPDGVTSARWTVHLARADLDDYLGSQAVAGGPPSQILPIVNSTSEIAPGQWRNAVWLFSHARSGWDQVYQRDYAATAADQKGVWVGSWGPIVETFQPTFSGTAPLGALEVQLHAMFAGAWQPWVRLDAAQSSLRDDHKGFQQTMIDPNYDWVVVS